MSLIDKQLTGETPRAGTMAHGITGAGIARPLLVNDDGTVNVTGGGGGVEYTEGDTDTSITGGAILWEDTSDTLRAVSAAKPLPVDLKNTSVAVTAASLPLPTGAATSANQTTIIGHVDGIEGLLTTIDADTSTLAAVDFATETTLSALNTKIPVSPATTGKQDSIITELQNIDAGKLEEATFTGRIGEVQASPTANTVLDRLKTIGTNTATIAGAVSGTEVQVDVLTMPTTTVQATNLDIRDLSSASDTVTVHGDVGVIDQLDLTNSNPAAVAIVDGNGDQITSFGGGTQYTEGDTDASITGTAMLMEGAANALVPVQGTAADGLLVNLGANNDVTVSGVSTAANQTTIIGHVDGIETLLGTIDADTSALAGAVSGSEMQVDIVSSAAIPVTDNGSSLTVDYATTGSGTATGALRVELPTNGTGVIATVGAVTAITNALPAGSNVIGALTANQSVNVAQMNGVATTMGNGASGTGVQRVTIASDSTGQIISRGPVAIDAAISTNQPVIVGGRASTATPTAMSADNDIQAVWLTRNGATVVDGGIAHDAADAGSPAKIGAKATTALSGITLVANADRTDLFAGVDGVQIVRTDSGLEDKVSGNASNTDGASTQVIAAAGAGVKTYLTDITLTNTSSSNIYVEIKDGTTVKWTFPVPGNGGVTHSFSTPLAGTANTAWNFDASAATTTLYCSAAGFKSKI